MESVRGRQRKVWQTRRLAGERLRQKHKKAAVDLFLLLVLLLVLLLRLLLSSLVASARVFLLHFLFLPSFSLSSSQSDLPLLINISGNTSRRRKTKAKKKKKKESNGPLHRRTVVMQTQKTHA